MVFLKYKRKYIVVRRVRRAHLLATHPKQLEFKLFFFHFHILFSFHFCFGVAKYRIILPVNEHRRMFVAVTNPEHSAKEVS